MVTNAITFAANVAATPVTGDNSLALTSQLTPEAITATQNFLLEKRTKNALFSFFNPGVATAGGDAMGVTPEEYRTYGTAPGIVLIKVCDPIQGTREVKRITLLPIPNP